VPEGVWAATLADYEAELATGDSSELELPDSLLSGEARRRLCAFARAYRRHSPHEAPLASRSPAACPACSALAVRPSHARHASRTAVASPPEPVARALQYGRCDACGHGVLFDRDLALLERSYGSADYYQSRDGQGTGYDAYGNEAAYREAKAARLLARVSNATSRPLRTLLEVGSGFGYTRAVAERSGLRTTGVDRNPHACDEAARRYGLATHTGTLASALADEGSGIRPGAADAVLYHFVLEHVADVAGELRVARRALGNDGRLVLVIPSMQAAELAVFSASYRSFRADHLHLFTRASLAAFLEVAGFELDVCESGCNLHLLHPCLSPAELDSLYASGLGPDLFVVARSHS
jgi:SAM-dependent methyltransferase